MRTNGGGTGPSSLDEVGRPRDFQTARAGFTVRSWQERGRDRVGLEVPPAVAAQVGLEPGAKVKVTVWGSRAHTVTGFFEDVLVAGEGNLLLLSGEGIERLGWPDELEVRILEVFTGLGQEGAARLDAAVTLFEDDFDGQGHEEKLARYDEFVAWFKEDFLGRRVMDRSYELGSRDLDELLSYLDYTSPLRREGFGFFRTGLAPSQWHQMVEDPSRFRDAVAHLLAGPGPLARRIDEVLTQDRFRVKNFGGGNLIPITALLLGTSRDAYVHILSMSHKERKLRALGILPALPADASPGTRFAAFEEALLGLRDRLKLRWDPRKLSLFLYSRPFVDAFEARVEASAPARTGLGRGLVWGVPASDRGYLGACSSPEGNRGCPAAATVKKRCAAGFGCDVAYALRDRVIPVPEGDGPVPVLGECVFLVAPGAGGPRLVAVMVAREEAHHYPLRLDNGDVRYLERYVRASPDYLVDLTLSPLPWSGPQPSAGFTAVPAAQAIGALRGVEAATGDERMGVLVRCYQGLEDPGVTTERLFRLDDFRAFLHGDAGGRFHFPDEVVLNYHTALRTKPFVILTGLSGTGKTKLAQLYARFMTGQGEAGDRYEVIAVRPDWMDGKSLLGFYNVLTERYQSTPFLDMLLRAARNPARRYYVVLDEMNLAKVEYYFADFLSAMESGEEVQLHDLAGHAIKAGADGDVDFAAVPPRVRVPENLAFTGTVNIDETTYMFSPKVLDRANTIEFDDVDLERYFALNPFPGLEEQIRVLQGLERRLARHGLHFGYRVAGEIMSYVRGATGAGMGAATALDLQIKQKILPKFHGSRSRLEDALLDLLAVVAGVSSFREDEGGVELDWILERLAGDGEGLRNVPYPESARKVGRMLRDLRRDGFVSFA